MNCKVVQFCDMFVFIRSIGRYLYTNVINA